MSKAISRYAAVVSTACDGYDEWSIREIHYKEGKDDFIHGCSPPVEIWGIIPQDLIDDLQDMLRDLQNEDLPKYRLIAGNKLIKLHKCEG